MAYYFPEIPKSSYALSYNYTRPRNLPVKYREVPSIVNQPAIVEAPREFPIEPTSPIRCNPFQQSPAAGLGSKGVPSQRVFDPYKEVVRNDGYNRDPEAITIPLPTIKGLPVIRGGNPHLPIDPHLDKDMAKKVYKERVFVSTAKRTMEECAIPMRQPVPPTTTREQRPDMVRLLPQKYESSVAIWQKVPLWDKIQPRRFDTRDEANPAIERGRKIEAEKRDHQQRLDESITADVQNLLQNNRLASSYTLHHCGYLGFQPRSPTGEPMCRKERQPVMQSVSQATHCKFPSREYHPMFYSRHAPMSKQLTLTYPYNPFNKIEEDTEFSAYSE